jgi:hypothetical protein
MLIFLIYSARKHAKLRLVLKVLGDDSSNERTTLLIDENSLYSRKVHLPLLTTTEWDHPKGYGATTNKFRSIEVYG